MDLIWSVGGMLGWSSTLPPMLRRGMMGHPQFLSLTTSIRGKMSISILVSSTPGKAALTLLGWSVDNFSFDSGKTTKANLVLVPDSGRRNGLMDSFPMGNSGWLVYSLVVTTPLVFLNTCHWNPLTFVRSNVIINLQLLPTSAD